MLCYIPLAFETTQSMDPSIRSSHWPHSLAEPAFKRRDVQSCSAEPTPRARCPKRQHSLGAAVEGTIPPYEEVGGVFAAGHVHLLEVEFEEPPSPTSASDLGQVSVSISWVWTLLFIPLRRGNERSTMLHVLLCFVWLLFWWGPPKVRDLSSQGLRNQPRRRAKPASVDGNAKSAKSGSGQNEMKPMVGSPRLLVVTLGFESDQKPRVSEFGGVRFLDLATIRSAI